MSSVLVVVSTELVANPESIREIQELFSGKDVHQQLLERVDAQAISLPPNKYAEVYIAGGDLTMQSANSLFDTMAPQGVLSGKISPKSKSMLLISGLSENNSQWIKPSTESQPAQVSLKLNSRPSSSKPKSRLFQKSSDLIDEDDLVSDTPAFKVPEKCQPADGSKRRKACKDCTCGMKDAEDDEVEKQRSQQTAVLLSHDEIAEIDFTVPGKAVGGCGSCALGDAFRCDGCPYIGLPPFKPGETVSIDQLGDDF